MTEARDPLVIGHDGCRMTIHPRFPGDPEPRIELVSDGPLVVGTAVQTAWGEGTITDIDGNEITVSVKQLPRAENVHVVIAKPMTEERDA